MISSKAGYSHLTGERETSPRKKKKNQTQKHLGKEMYFIEKKKITFHLYTMKILSCVLFS